MPLVAPPVVAGEGFERGAPAGGGVGVGLGVERGDLVEHQVEEFGLARYIAIEGHGADAEVRGDAAHGQGAEPVGIGGRHRRGDDAVEGEPWLGATAGPVAEAPKQLQAARDIAAAAVFCRRHRAVILCRPAQKLGTAYA